MIQAPSKALTGFTHILHL